ncbi:RNA polymerase sigma factor [Ktedonospora formicarum]|uniref:RNA polymerase sigma factor n=1 Tax=Ktedonospora formicarum TaxID=2778364 RepID=UPI001C69080A|nr:sigma-70 family RNA polymerase sigma factor [Ktedonospora formicarum]
MRQESPINSMEQGKSGEWQRLRSALLNDQGRVLTATRLRLARLARARGIELQDVDDVVQETLFEAWSHLDRLHTPGGFHVWIDEICRNVCRRTTRRYQINLLRQTSPSSAKPHTDTELLEPFEALTAPESSDPLEALSRQDQALLLDRALGFLSPAARQIVETCLLLELPRSEVATQLNISRGTLETRLHRVRQQLRQILSGPLRREAEDLGLRLDEAITQGWQETRLWCPLCGQRRLQGCFLVEGARSRGPNIHLRCPGCSQRYGQDTVHSMGLVTLEGLHTFRPAWKRTMQGLTERITQALVPGQHSCLHCGKPATIRVRGENLKTSSPQALIPSGYTSIASIAEWKLTRVAASLPSIRLSTGHTHARANFCKTIPEPKACQGN